VQFNMKIIWLPRKSLDFGKR